MTLIRDTLQDEIDLGDQLPEAAFALHLCNNEGAERFVGLRRAGRRKVRMCVSQAVQGCFESIEDLEHRTKAGNGENMFHIGGKRTEGKHSPGRFDLFTDHQNGS